MKEHFTYPFTSPHTRDAMLLQLNELGPWTWNEDRALDSLVAIDARGGALTIVGASTSQPALVLDFDSNASDAPRTFYAVLATIFQTLLPALEQEPSGVPDAVGDLVHVPGGRFLLGLTSSEADALALELAKMEVAIGAEREEIEATPENVEAAFKQRRPALEVAIPAHEAEVGEYYISRYPVTVAEYAAYIAKSGAPAPETWSDRRPPDREFVTGISWREAMEFADYHSCSLPTEAEWERAARNGRSFFPWGDAFFPLGLIAFPQSESSARWRVGTRRRLASALGVQDLIGEFGEYTCEPFKPYPGSDLKSFERWYPNSRKERAVRGGYDVLQGSTTVYRNGIEEDVRARDVKFRLVRRASR